MPNYYITDNGTSTALTYTVDSNINIDSTPISARIKYKTGINPILYFKYIKNKFKMLERIKLDARLKRLEKAFQKSMENGQEVLANKFLEEFARETRESVIYAKGIKLFIERDDIMKHKRNIRDGHISDTLFKDYTRIIPDKVLKRKKEVEDIFDDFVIFHYWDEKAKDIKKMSLNEKNMMKDPVLFGIIKETNRLYFIADWEDEYCDLTFEEIIDKIGEKDEQVTLNRDPKFNV